MRFYIYHSELTHRTLVSATSHGKAWAMPDEETYDLVKEVEGDGLSDGQVIMIDESGQVDVIEETDLA